MKKSILMFAVVAAWMILRVTAQDVKPAYDVISRLAGKQYADRFDLKIEADSGEHYSVKVKENKVYVVASGQVALCRGVYEYLSNACHSIISWSGNHINMPEKAACL